LKKKFLSEKDIENKLRFSRDYFYRRVPRAALPRSQQYFRVRAVYEQYGPLISEKMRQPLFNDISWKKANGVLEEILEGYTSTPPDISFTYHEIDADGNPAFDENGLELFHNKCVRASSATIPNNWTL